jgi:hypothetical protein
MAEPRRQRSLCCHIHYLPDRHVPQKISQVYRWLVPQEEPERAQPQGQVTTASHEKDGRPLRSSFL